MAVHIRKDGFWNNITYNIPPFSVAGNWVDVTNYRYNSEFNGSTYGTPVEKAKRIYTNNTGKLMLVRAVVGIDRVARGLPATDISGSFSVGYVDGQEVSRYNDNGTDANILVKFETQFFVPNYSEYYVRTFKKNGTEWNGLGNGAPIIETVSWTEFTFQ
tara:strand:- start:99 stop:575 length:477 start_codon:yes stop_codon:yes gene_type:complete